MSASDSGAVDETAGLSVRVLSGAPTPEELAAVIAVVTEAYASEAKRATTDARLKSKLCECVKK